MSDGKFKAGHSGGPGRPRKLGTDLAKLRDTMRIEIEQGSQRSLRTLLTAHPDKFLSAFCDVARTECMIAESNRAAKDDADLRSALGRAEAAQAELARLEAELDALQDALRGTTRTVVISKPIAVQAGRCAVGDKLTCDGFTAFGLVRDEEATYADERPVDVRIETIESGAK